MQSSFITTIYADQLYYHDIYPRYMQPSFITTIYADQLYCQDLEDPSNMLHQPYIHPAYIADQLYCHDIYSCDISTHLCQNELQIDESLTYSELNRKVTLMLVCFKHKPKNSSYG